jgi:hypothetical protein
MVPHEMRRPGYHLDMRALALRAENPVESGLAGAGTRNANPADHNSENQRNEEARVLLHGNSMSLL